MIQGGHCLTQLARVSLESTLFNAPHMVLYYIMIIMVIWQLMAAENLLLLFFPGSFVATLMATFLFCKFTVQVDFASLCSLRLFVLLDRRFSYISSTNSYPLNFILISWSSTMLKEQINFYCKPDSDSSSQKTIHRGYGPLVPHPYFLLR